MIIDKKLGLTTTRTHGQAATSSTRLLTWWKSRQREFEAISERRGVLGAMDNTFTCAGEIQEESMWMAAATGETLGIGCTIR